VLLPTYSPDLNAIERVFLATKTIFKRWRLDLEKRGWSYDLADLVLLSFSALTKESVFTNCRTTWDRWMSENITKATVNYQYQR
jgi:transposase